MSGIGSAVAVGAGAAMTIATVKAWQEGYHTPESPGKVTKEEVFAMSALPLTAATALGALGSYGGASMGLGSGAFLGGCALGLVGLGAVAGFHALGNVARDH